MKFVYPEIGKVFDTDIGKINTLVIENQALLINLLSDIYGQIEGIDGKSVLSDNKGILPMSKFAELLTQFVPFELSKKTLISKISTLLEKKAVAEDMYLETVELLSSIERYLSKLSFDFNCNPIFQKISINSLIKASGFEINETYDSLGEKILDYFELVREFDHDKLFITFNLRSFLSDSETQLFIEDILKREIKLIMIESSERKLLSSENRLLIDSDLCEIS